MVEWHHWHYDCIIMHPLWLNGHKSEQVPGDGEGQGSLPSWWGPWVCKQSDKTERLNNSLLYGPILTSVHDYWKNYSFDWSEVKWSHSVVSDSATPWTVAHQAPPSMGFSRQEYWSGLPFPSPGDLPNPGIKPRSPTLQADALTSEPPKEVALTTGHHKVYKQ